MRSFKLLIKWLIGSVRLFEISRQILFGAFLQEIGLLNVLIKDWYDYEKIERLL